MFMKTIEERAMRYGWKRMEAYHNLDDGSNYIMWERFRSAYADGATEQKKIDIDEACNIFCHTGCPHKTDSFNCLNDKCDTWKIFRRMMEE